MLTMIARGSFSVSQGNVHFHLFCHKATKTSAFNATGICLRLPAPDSITVQCALGVCTVIQNGSYGKYVIHLSFPMQSQYATLNHVKKNKNNKNQTNKQTNKQKQKTNKGKKEYDCQPPTQSLSSVHSCIGTQRGSYVLYK